MGYYLVQGILYFQNDGSVLVLLTFYGAKQLIDEIIIHVTRSSEIFCPLLSFFSGKSFELVVV